MSGSAAGNLGQQAHVIVAAELKALFRAGRRASARVPRSRPVPAAPPAPPVPASLEQDPAAEATIRHRLRCDGRRPVTFDGVCLLHRATERAAPRGAGAIRQEFALYLTGAGETLLRLATLVPEGVAARPIHLVERLRGPEDLARTVAAYDPAAAWPGLAAAEGAPDPALADVAAALRRDIRRLVEAALRAAPPSSANETGDDP